MSWKWRYGDHPCHSQNLPQNLGKYYITSWFLSSLQSGNRLHTTSLLPGCTDEIAAERNSTLANLTSLDHSWSQTHRIIIICRTREFIKLFVVFTKSSVLFFFSIYLSGFQSLATSNPLLFRRESSLPLTLKKESQCGVGWCMVTFPEENFPSVFVATL